MKKRRSTPRSDAPEAPSAPGGATEITLEGSAASPTSDEPAKVEPKLYEAALPRAALLGAATHAEVPSPITSAAKPATAQRERPPRRFALLAACVASAAALGAIGGSLAETQITRLFAVAAAPATPRSDTAEEIRSLKESVAQLRGTVKTILDNIAGMRTGLNTSLSNSAGQLSKISEAIEKLEHHQAERQKTAAAAAQASPETTGSIAPPASSATPAAPAVVQGWIVRKATRGAALVEGRYGIIEVEPGDHLPGVGRVEDIKRQDGRWVVVTARGLIVPPQ